MPSTCYKFSVNAIRWHNEKGHLWSYKWLFNQFSYKNNWKYRLNIVMLGMFTGNHQMIQRNLGSHWLGLESVLDAWLADLHWILAFQFVSLMMMVFQMLDLELPQSQFPLFRGQVRPHWWLREGESLAIAFLSGLLDGTPVQLLQMLREFLDASHNHWQHRLS